MNRAQPLPLWPVWYRCTWLVVGITKENARRFSLSLSLPLCTRSRIVCDRLWSKIRLYPEMLDEGSFRATWHLPRGAYNVRIPYYNRQTARTSRDSIVIATKGERKRERERVKERVEWTGGRSSECVQVSERTRQTRALAFITDTNLILRFIIESMTIIVRTGIP